MTRRSAVLYPEDSEPVSTGPVPKPLGSGTGKHRKPHGGGRTQR
ncbi:hypothetical protein [Streptomyces sp. NPDC004270]